MARAVLLVVVLAGQLTVVGGIVWVLGVSAHG